MGDPEVVAESFDTVRVTVGERAAHVATVTIDRPDARNALNAQVRRELKAAFDAVEAADVVRVIVLTGSPEAKAFVSGADVRELRDRGPLEQRQASKRPRVYEYADELEKPIIARIDGHALGGGCELALGCDIRIASERARLGQPEITLGLIPGGGATQRLPRLVGEGQAMRLILSGEVIDGEEAHDIGLVDEVHPVVELDERVDELAGTIASHSPVSLEYAKQAVRASSRMDLDRGIEYEAELFAQLFSTADTTEGIDAFLADREPNWQGR